MAEALGDLLAQGERAAFHGPPAKAVEALEKALEIATRESRAGEKGAASWLLGVSLGAAGRYGTALSTLEPAVLAAEAGGASKDARVFGALSSASQASVLRQLGRHAEARIADQRGLALTDAPGEAAFACRLGLAADAVGLGESQNAHAEADAAAAMLPERPTEWWRQRVRYEWVLTEIALLDGDPEAAAEAADAAVDRAEKARAPRHVAKSQLFLGVAQVECGDHPAAVETLRKAATLAESLGALPLVWPSRAMLGALQMGADATESASSLAAARTAVLSIANDLPEHLRNEWLARPDLGALLEG